MIAAIVYCLCALTSWMCALLLLRAYAARRARLLFWSGTAFCVFGVSNVFLFVDLVVVPTVDLSLLRSSLTLLGIGLLLWGLIWEKTS